MLKLDVVGFDCILLVGFVIGIGDLVFFLIFFVVFFVENVLGLMILFVCMVGVG